MDVDKFDKERLECWEKLRDAGGHISEARKLVEEASGMLGVFTVTFPGLGELRGKTLIIYSLLKMLSEELHEVLRP